MEFKTGECVSDGLKALMHYHMLNINFTRDKWYWRGDGTSEMVDFVISINGEMTAQSLLCLDRIISCKSTCDSTTVFAKDSVVFVEIYDETWLERKLVFYRSMMNGELYRDKDVSKLFNLKRPHFLVLLAEEEVVLSDMPMPFLLIISSPEQVKNWAERARLSAPKLRDHTSENAKISAKIDASLFLKKS